MVNSKYEPPQAFMLQPLCPPTCHSGSNPDGQCVTGFGDEDALDEWLALEPDDT